MTSVLTVLEARVALDRQGDLKDAYREAVAGPRPPGLVRSILLQDTTDRLLWRIETLWESFEALAAMRGTGTPRGVLMFRSAGAEPTLSVLEVVDELTRGAEAIR